jgi:hypothetical protein
MENVKGSFAMFESSEISLSAAKAIRDTADELNYMALAVCSSQARGTVNSMPKTETRCTAESSVIPAVLSAVTDAASLLCPSGVLIPGSNSNSRTEISSSSIECLALCRSGSTEQCEFNFYRRNDHHPMIETTQQRLGKDPNGPVPHHLNVSLFLDGAGPQLRAIVDPGLQDLEEELKIGAYKHYPARCGAEQAADLTRVFKGIKTKVNDIPSAADDGHEDEYLGTHEGYDYDDEPPPLEGDPFVVPSAQASLQHLCACSSPASQPGRGKQPAPQA